MVGDTVRQHHGRLDDERTDRIVELRDSGLIWKIISIRTGLSVGQCMKRYKAAKQSKMKTLK